MKYCWRSRAFSIINRVARADASFAWPVLVTLWERQSGITGKGKSALQVASFGNGKSGGFCGT